MQKGRRERQGLFIIHQNMDLPVMWDKEIFITYKTWLAPLPWKTAKAVVYMSFGNSVKVAIKVENGATSLHSTVLLTITLDMFLNLFT